MSKPGKSVVGEKVDGKVKRNIHGGLEVVVPPKNPDTSVIGRHVRGEVVENKYGAISYVGGSPPKEVALAVANQYRADSSSQSRSSAPGPQRLGEGAGLIQFCVVGRTLKTRYDIRLSASQTVKDVVKVVSEKEGRGELSLQLKLGDKILNPDDTLASSGVVENIRLIAEELVMQNVVGTTAQKEH